MMMPNTRRPPNVYQKISPRAKSYKPAVDTGYPVDVWIPARPKQANYTWPLVLSLALILLLACSILIGSVLAIWFNGDRIMPGVEVHEVFLGGLSRDEALNRLQTAWSQPSVVLVGDGKTWAASPEALGFSLDAEGTIDQAHQIGRSPESLQRWLAKKGRITIEPIRTFDSAKAESFLQALAPQIATQPENAGIRISDGRAEMTPPIMGQNFDVPSTLEQLAQNPNRILAEGNVPIITQPVQPAVMDTSATVAAANEMLSMVINLQAFDPVSGHTVEIEVTPELWRPWLSLEPGDGGQLNWLIATPQLKVFLQEQSNALGSGRYLDVDQASAAISQSIDDQQRDVVLRIYHDEQQHTVQPGETLSSIGRHYGIPYPWIQQANSDLGSGLFAGQTLTIPSPDVLLPLPAIPDKRIVVSLTQQKVWVFEDGGLKWEWLASTGIDESPTSPGIFQIQSHEPNAYANNWDLWMPHFMGVYRPVPYADFMNGFHGFPTRNGHTLLWTGDLGRRVTYGCILLSSENAAALYDWAEDGVVVEIQS